MHPRNPYYDSKPDFRLLSEKHPELRTYTTRSLSEKLQTVVQELDETSEQIRINFKKTGAVHQLTEVLLKEDFNLEVKLDRAHLCPALTRSLNYVAWIEDLLSLFSGSICLNTSQITGIDVGTGASCIFPLLVCRKYEAWDFVATDISGPSMLVAKENINRNKLDKKIKLKLSKENGPVFDFNFLRDRESAVANVSETASPVEAFTMCNPPFFESKQHAEKTQRPSRAFQGTDNELWATTAGGEVGFIKKMILESVEKSKSFRRCLFSSMVGIRKNLDDILKFLKSFKEIHFIRATTLRQGHTFRWAVAWAFLNDPVTTTNTDPCVGKKRKRISSTGVTETSKRLNARLRSLKQSFETSLDSTVVSARVEESIQLRYSNRSHRSFCGNLIIFESEPSGSNAKILLMVYLSIRECKGGKNGCSISIVLLDEFAANRNEFISFCHHIKSDVERSNRFWRRRLKAR